MGLGLNLIKKTLTCGLNKFFTQVVPLYLKGSVWYDRKTHPVVV